jgi:hypothetical protein
MLDDGVESLLLDRATSIDVRGDGYDSIAAVRTRVVGAFPRGPFDRAGLLNRTGIVDWMARSPWATGGP